MLQMLNRVEFFYSLISLIAWLEADSQKTFYNIYIYQITWEMGDSFGGEIDENVLERYEIKRRIGKGVSV